MGFSTTFTLAIGAALVAALPLSGRAQDPRGAEAADAVPGTTGGPVQLAPVPPGMRSSGAVFIGYRGSDGETTGALVTLAPAPRTFVRVGAEVTPRSPEGSSRFLWGLGYEDVRDRTFFLDVHDWGPVRPGQSVTLRGAEASFGYKLPTLRGGPFGVATAAFATVPFDGGTYAGARLVLTVGRTWFMSTAFGWTIPGVHEAAGDQQRWRLSAALGRWDGRPGGLFVTYRDELTDRQLNDMSRVDRQARGVLALGVSWVQ